MRSWITKRQPAVQLPNLLIGVHQVLGAWSSRRPELFHRPPQRSSPRSQERADDLVEQVGRGISAETKDILEVEIFVGRIRRDAQRRPRNAVLMGDLRNRRGLHVKTRAVRKIGQQAVSDDS